MIIKQLYKQLHLNDKIKFATDLALASNDAATSNSDLKPYINLVQEQLESLEKAITLLSTTKNLDIAAAKDRRNNALWQLCQIVKSLSSSSSATMSKAATKIKDVFSEVGCGTLTQSKFDETRAIDMAIEKINSTNEYLDDLQLIEAKGWYDELKGQQQIYKELLSKLYQQNPNCEEADIQPLIDKLEVSIDRLTSYLEMRLSFAPMVALTKLATRIAEIGLYYQRQAAWAIINKES